MAMSEFMVMLILMLGKCCMIFVSCLSEEVDDSAPNIVFILADDLDLTLGGMDPLHKTRTLLQSRGTTFENAFVTTPLCCPSRSSILTGRYVHNHGTWNNSIEGGCSSISWQNGYEKKAFVTQLHKQNYTTFYAGKYLNQYGMSSVGGVEHVPPGWDWWQGLVGNSVYYNYSLSINGTERTFGDNPNRDYLTSVIGELATQFLDHVDNNSKFFMMISPPCPHAPFTPLPKYSQEFANRTAPRTPNFNIAGGMGKHWLVRQPPSPLPQTVINEVDDVFRNRWRTLLSLDDLVEGIVNTLELKNLLEKTYIFFTSDHGFHLGQFSLPWDKRQPYEFDIRVPLIVRGPRKSSGSSIQVPVLNIDLAPTFLELAGLQPDLAMDGQSFAKFLYRRHSENGTHQETEGNGYAHEEDDSDDCIGQHLTNTETSWRKRFVVEHDGGSSTEPVPGCPQYSQGGVVGCYPDCICEDSWNNSYTCIRTLKPGHNFLSCHFHDWESFVEEYNLTADPFQMTNLAFQRSS